MYSLMFDRNENEAMWDSVSNTYIFFNNMVIVELKISLYLTLIDLSFLKKCLLKALCD